MKRKTLAFILLINAFLVMLLPTTAAGAAEESVVRAVLFYSQTCGHCHMVINDVLLPMLDEYGDRLLVIGLDTSQAAGTQLYNATIEQFKLPPERLGVPTLVIQDTVLVGSAEIPDQFPTLVEEGMAAGGTDWPDIPGLAQLIADNPPDESPTPDPTTADATATPAVAATETRPVLTVGEDEIPVGTEEEAPPENPEGATLAWMVLIGMIVSLVYAGQRLTRSRTWQQIPKLLKPGKTPLPPVHTWVIPCLCLVGLGVASYLAYVEANQVLAVCGPVGDCNAVQTSDYALFLGVPVAVWGVLNYLAVAAFWAGHRFLTGRVANLSLLGLLGLTIFGTFFSIYLTYLELFAIHAICAWCISSAVVTTALMLLVVIPITGRRIITLRRARTPA